MVEIVNVELPLATEEEKRGGWTFSYKFLEETQAKILEETGCGVGLEEIESVLMVTLNIKG